MSQFLQKAVKKYVKTPGLRNEIDEIFEFYLLRQKICGLQILDPEWSWKKQGLLRIPSFLLTVYMVVGTVEVISNTDDLNLIMAGVLTLLVNVTMVVKIALLLGQREKLPENYVKAKMYIFGLMKDTPSKRNRIISRLKLALRVFMLFTCTVIMTFIARHFWNHHNGIRQPLSRSTSTLMPMTSPYFELGLLIHLLYLTEACFFLLFNDTWYVSSCLFFIEASDISLEALAVENCGNKEAYAKDLDDALRRFYVIHANTMEFLKVLNENFKWIGLVLITVVLLMVSIFLMMLKKEIDMEWAVVVIPSNIQIIYWNLFGELISSRGQKIKMALINFDWTSMSIRDQKKYYIITSYQNRKVAVITALGNDLSLVTLTWIYKMIYQMFAVINSTL